MGDEKLVKRLSDGCEGCVKICGVKWFGHILCNFVSFFFYSCVYVVTEDVVIGCKILCLFYLENINAAVKSIDDYYGLLIYDPLYKILICSS